MGAVAAGAAVVGTGLSVYGQIKSAQDQADIDSQKATLARVQAQEVLDREQINDANMQQSTLRAKLDFGSAFAATGRQGGIGSQLELQRQADEQIALNDREANFQAKMLQAGADMNDQLASETRTSGYINAAGTLLGNTGKLASSPSMRDSSGTFNGVPLNPSHAPQPLPNLPEGY